MPAKRSAQILAVLVLLLPAAASAQPPRTHLIDPYKTPMPKLQRIVHGARCRTPPTTIMVWPLADLGADPNAGGVDFLGQRPFLIGEPAQPSPQELFHEIGHVLDDGWMTPEQRAAFAAAAGFPANLWLFPDGSDGVSDNFAQAYALACEYGPHPPRRLIHETTGFWPRQWAAEYVIVGQVVWESLHLPVQPPHEQF